MDFLWSYNHFTAPLPPFDLMLGQFKQRLGCDFCFMNSQQCRFYIFQLIQSLKDYLVAYSWAGITHLHPLLQQPTCPIPFSFANSVGSKQNLDLDVIVSSYQQYRAMYICLFYFTQGLCWYQKLRLPKLHLPLLHQQLQSHNTTFDQEFRQAREGFKVRYQYDKQLVVWIPSFTTFPRFQAKLGGLFVG